MAISVISVTRLSASRVQLVVSDTVLGQAYTLRVQKIKDTEGNLVYETFNFTGVGNPKLLSATSLNITTIRLVFNEDMSNDHLLVPTNYVIVCPPSFEQIFPSVITKVNAKTVDITITGEMATGVDNYTISVNNLKNTADIIIDTPYNTDTFNGIGIAPIVASAIFTDVDTFDVFFSEDMDKTTTEAILNYSITVGPVTPNIDAAALDATKEVVHLELDADVVTGNYIITCSGAIADKSGNPLDIAGRTASFNAIVWDEKAIGSGPVVNFDGAMAFNAACNSVLVVGGAASTYTWNGATWVLEAPAHSPPARCYHAMARTNHVDYPIIMFGGFIGAAAVQDMHSWKGGNWIDVVPATPPGIRCGHSMSYNTDTAKIVMFGGSITTSSFASLQDTWEWDNVDWTEKASGAVPKPSPRFQPYMTYDQANNVTVLFGGFGNGVVNAETWFWDGADWVEQHPVHSPSIRYGGTMVFNESLGVVVLFGGYTAFSGYNNETWIWDGTDWEQITIGTIPAKRMWQAMSYDSVRNKVVMCCGRNAAILNDTWES